MSNEETKINAIDEDALDNNMLEQMHKVAFQILCDVFVLDDIPYYLIAEGWPFFVIAALLIILIFLLVKGINNAIDKKKLKKDRPETGSSEKDNSNDRS